jgi:putative tricarboxylic transport membrane protein
MKINDAIFGAIFAVLGAVVLVHVQSFPTIPGQQYGPGLFPGTVAAGFLVCGILLIASGLRHREGGWIAVGEWMRVPRRVYAFAVVVLGIVLYVLVAEHVGFLIVAPLLLLAWLRAFGVTWRASLVTAVVATLVIWYAFYRLLRVPLPWGVLTPWAF